MKNIFNKIIIFSLLVFSFQSCVKDTYDFDKMTNPKWDPALCAHVVHTVMSLSNFYKLDSLREFREDKDRLITVVFRNPVFSKTASSIISIPDQTFLVSVPNIQVGFISGMNSITIPYQMDYTFNFPNNAEIDSITLDTVLIQLHYDGTLPYSGIINTTCNSITKSGTPLSMGFHVDQGMNKDTTLVLLGYKFAFDNTGIVKNQLHFLFNTTVYKNPNMPAIDTNTYSFNNSISFTKSKFRSIYGYLGQQNINIDLDSINITLYGQGGKGKYYCVDPGWKLYTKNYIGVPLNVNVNSIMFKSDNDSVALTGSGIPNPWKIGCPSIPGMFDTTSIYVNKNNSNIQNASKIGPKYIFSHLNAITNPNGKVKQNFVLSSSRVDVDEELDMPLYGNASGFTLLDTIGFNYHKMIGDNEKNIDYFNFLINAQNSFPVGGKLQVYLTDSLYHFPPIDSLFHEANNTIAPAVSGNSPAYKATIPITTFKKITVDHSRQLLWRNVKYMIIRADFSTYNNGNNIVKIYGDNNLIFDFGFQTQLNFQSKK